MRRRCKFVGIYSILDSANFNPIEVARIRNLGANEKELQVAKKARSASYGAAIMRNKMLSDHKEHVSLELR